MIERFRIVRAAPGEPLAGVSLSRGVCRYRPGQVQGASIERADAALSPRHEGRNRVGREHPAA